MLPMPPVLLMLLWLSVLGSYLPAREPQVRYVQVEQAHVYAGPGEDYYPTSILQRGQGVEVYDQTDDGWLAIRPPQGSYSWLPAADGLLLPGGRIVEVTEAGAVAWIGSSLGTAKQYRWQVQLNRGEQLAVLGEQSILDPSSHAKALWYKIAPPNGEFRWIRREATTAESPQAREAEPKRLTDQQEARSLTELSQASAGADDGASTNDTEDEGDQVTVASAEEPLHSSAQSNNSKRRRQRTQVKARSAEDPWESWHAMEFKNGTFSFPGISRMFGVEPPRSSRSAPGPDPFDLTANAARPRQPIRSSTKEQQGQAIANNSPRIVNGEELAGRQSRGWRDPRQLRANRMQEAAGLDSAAPMESLLADNSVPSTLPPAVVDAGLDTEQPIGTSVLDEGVVTAAARGESVNFNGGNESGGDSDASWHGINQAPDARRVQAVSVQADLNDLQQSLSAMVAGPEHTWDLAPLAARTRHYIEHGATAIERGQARLLLERIESFAQLSQQSSQLGMSLPPASLPGQRAANQVLPNQPLSNQALPNQAGSQPGRADQFDATGWLVPVHSNGRDMPTHALTNDSGKIIVYLTAAPGINLVRFESQQVGVYGLRGYLPQLKANHVQVERTVRLR